MVFEVSIGLLMYWIMGKSVNTVVDHSAECLHTKPHKAEQTYGRI